MNLIKDKIKQKYSPIGLVSLKRNLRVLKQVGKSNLSRDMKRKALMPGKRISKTGHIYWEDRKNRSDARGSKV